MSYTISLFIMSCLDQAIRFSDESKNLNWVESNSLFFVGIAGILKAIINGIANFFSIIVNCLTCRRGGGRKRGGTHNASHV